MKLTRRNVLLTSGATAVMAAVGTPPVHAASVDAHIEKITGGAETMSGSVKLDVPEIAENGNTVPIRVEASGAVLVAIFADDNPMPPVATFRFGPLNPTQSASTRIRLARTQNVIAIAEMADGSFQRAEAEVKVTIGGCGS